MGGPRGRTLQDRFLAKAWADDGEACWPWTGYRNGSGYGQIYAAPGKTILAHRASWVIFRGPFDPLLDVLHKCDNPPCVRPDHLFLGTAKDNAADCWAKGRGSLPPRAKPGHAPKALNPERVRALRARRAEGASYNVLAGEFGIAMTTVRDVVKGYIWGHVK